MIVDSYGAMRGGMMKKKINLALAEVHISTILLVGYSPILFSTIKKMGKAISIRHLNTMIRQPRLIYLVTRPICIMKIRI